MRQDTGFDAVKFKKNNRYCLQQRDTEHRESPWGTTTKQIRIGKKKNMMKLMLIVRKNIDWFTSAWIMKVSNFR